MWLAGIRLRYLEWQGGEDVILLLHDVAEAADVWGVTAEKLQERGYQVFALDLRGRWVGVQCPCASPGRIGWATILAWPRQT